MRQIILIHTLLIAIGLACCTGCSQSNIKLHPVHGTIRTEKITDLVGSTVEIALAEKISDRGFGVITESGDFHIQSLQGGELLDGVPEGTYVVRVLPNDEDSDSRKRAVAAIPKKFLAFETSNLKISVPTDTGIEISF